MTVSQTERNDKPELPSQAGSGKKTKTDALTTQEEQIGQADGRAQAFMEEKDSDSRTRSYSGVMEAVIAVILVSFTLFELWANLTGSLGAVKLRTAHIMVLLPLAFMLYPTYRSESRLRKSMPVWEGGVCRHV